VQRGRLQNVEALLVDSQHRLGARRRAFSISVGSSRSYSPVLAHAAAFSAPIAFKLSGPNAGTVRVGAF
jgi:hypothetical protein